MLTAGWESIRKKPSEKKDKESMVKGFFDHYKSPPGVPKKQWVFSFSAYPFLNAVADRLITLF
jgi:hypothetical protein